MQKGRNFLPLLYIFFIAVSIIELIIVESTIPNTSSDFRTVPASNIANVDDDSHDVNVDLVMFSFVIEPEATGSACDC